MTHKQLKERYLGSSFAGYGHFKVGFTIYGKPCYTVTTNTMALDRLDDDMPQRTMSYYVTQRQALQSLYNEVRACNFEV
jgi:hypothetical protein